MTNSDTGREFLADLAKLNPENRKAIVELLQALARALRKPPPDQT